MDDVVAYAVIGVLTFAIGLILGYISLTRYYGMRFFKVAEACEKEDSIVPLIGELERES
jgi:hypothetical protein